MRRELPSGAERVPCPLRVKSGHDAPKSQCLLYPRKRTFDGDLRMSALCQKAKTINGLHGDRTTKRIVWVSGINKIATADGEQFLHFTHCFGNHVMRLTGLNLRL